jgi:hypothetical protein
MALIISFSCREQLLIDANTPLPMNFFPQDLLKKAIPGGLLILPGSPF